jgi:hypothetical protein
MTELDVNNQLPNLDELADCLVSRHARGRSMLVVPIVGAGASSGAGLPTFARLKEMVYDALLQGDPAGSALDRALHAEAKRLLPVGRSMLELSEFEFMGIASQFAYGSKVIEEVVSAAVSTARHRPLVYELFAHLAKHGFVDHFISLNFDELLDESLMDELPDRLSLATSPDDVPGLLSRHGHKIECCYLFKPFGSLTRANFKLQAKEVTQYGHESVWEFMIRNVFSPETVAPETVLLLVGYAAKEPAFARLMDELLRNRPRKTRVFVIDVDESIPTHLNIYAGDNCDLRYVHLPADLAFDLLLQLVRIKYKIAHQFGAWIPVARHQVIAAIPYRDTKADVDRRFRIELILQAIKSRGVFTIESLAEVRRIRDYAQNAHAVLHKMDKEGILASKPLEGRASLSSGGFRREDYALNRDLGSLAELLLQEWHRSPDAFVENWEVEHQDGALAARRSRVTYRDQLGRRFAEIAASPDIEVSAGVSPSTQWLFKQPTPLRSVTELMENTVTLLETALAEKQGKLTLYGIWTTGEWLFHPEGWAWEHVGQRLMALLKEESLDMSLVLAKNPDLGNTHRLKRGTEVLKTLSKFAGPGRCSVRQLSWGDQNRIMTLLGWTNASGNGTRSGIYMRRRLATPLVAPVLVKGDDCDVLMDIFERYTQKSDPLPETG